MRACGACFFGRFETFKDQFGACMREPPKTFAAMNPETGEFTVLHTRPEVHRQDYCFRFIHKTALPNSAGASGTPNVRSFQPEFEDEPEVP
jgi:hypothetical protein